MSAYLDQVTRQRDEAQQQLRDAESARDGAYRERAHLVAWLAALYPSVLVPAPDVEDDGWQIVYLAVGAHHQFSWHIAPTDTDLFDHVERVNPTDPRAQWDGHTTEQKYEAIRAEPAAIRTAMGLAQQIRTDTARMILDDTIDALLAWIGGSPTRALLLRLACRARIHNRICWGNPACPRYGRRKR
ncbi:hypothetical protein [Kitasatospora cineracea]|uniref:Uncharacterized protein n=1 Tax=Kitasatospora cineracea TaxID=88074 RepID=A0A3N4R7F7_9ACTN|nr:hypothetical protein [Kitasatospora cineracea]RPE27299.1 hypothetical protein EDD38_7444 [Kitasatospora cineracea]